MRILIEHLNNVAKALRSNSEQFKIAMHGDNTGGAREALSKFFLEKHLPHSATFVTGELFDQEDDRSGQIDLIVYPISSPKLHLFNDINLVFNDSALATIEVKSTLTTAKGDTPSHLKSALDSCVRIKNLTRSSSIRGIKNGQIIELKKTPVIIFAFDGPTLETLREKLWEYQYSNNISLDLMPDLITVLNRDYYLVQNNGWLIDPVKEENVHWSNNEEPEGVLLGMYAYLTLIIDAYSSQPHPMPFSKYLREITKNS